MTANLTDTALPLQGVKVIDFSHVLAGPACGYFLALLGAEVVKIESPGRGDAMRHRGGSDAARAADGMSTAYLTQAAGKRSLAVDVANAAGKAILLRLLDSADVFVENHRPTLLAKLGLDFASLASRNSRLIHCALTGYGRGGPLADAPAYDVNIQACSGLMSLTGTATSGPLRAGAPVIDYGTALAAGFAISSALLQRERTGQGSFIDVSMLETAFTLMSSTITDFLATGNAPQARGNQANSRSPGAGSFATLDGIISLGVNEEHQFHALARALGREHWLDDARFVDRASRKRHAAALEAELCSALMQHTADDWEPLLLANGVPAAKLRTLPESLACEHAVAREFIHREPHTGLQLPTLPFRINQGHAYQPQRPPPQRGEHSIEILTELGCTDTEIKQLLAAGVVEA